MKYLFAKFLHGLTITKKSRTIPHSAIRNAAFQLPHCGLCTAHCALRTVHWNHPQTSASRSCFKSRFSSETSELTLKK
jgi:hypothetical protein